MANVVFCAMLDVYSAIWIIITAIITYGTGLLIAKLRNKENKALSRLVLIITLVLCFGALFWVKYRDFTLDLIPGGEKFGEIIPSIAMPIGISFYIFQVTGYLIDIYYQRVEPVKHVGYYVASVSFFSKFTQGPIVPIHKFAVQLSKTVKLDVLQMRHGAVLILLGLFKKAVIADRLAVVADTVFGKPDTMSGLSTAIGIIFYAFQLYMDFAGYTDIAVGSAMMFGLDMPHNFNQPYLARSIGEFWRRWHITLSTWFKTYVYIPLGGSRVHIVRWAINILIVFLISGLWHGAGLTFVVWGLLHGLYQVVGRFTQGIRTKVKEKLMRKDTWMSIFTSVFCTFILACIAWTFFRATSLTDACNMLMNVIRGPWAFNVAELGIKIQEWYFSLFLIGVTIIMDIVAEFVPISSLIEKQILPVRWFAYLVLLFVLILFGMYGSMAADSFIYVSF